MTKNQARAYNHAYNVSPRGKARMARYAATPEAKEKRKQWNAAHSERRSVWTKRWREKNREKFRLIQSAANRLRLYGLSLPDFNAMAAAQGNRCAICGSPDPRDKRGWHVDHDHETSRVRGLLCSACNRGLGGFRDDTEALLKAIEYLRSHNPVK